MNARAPFALAATGLLAACASLPGIYELPPPAAPPVPAPASVAPGAPEPTPWPTPKVVQMGAPAPDIDFTEPGGRARKLSEFRGRFVALVFFAHW